MINVYSKSDDELGRLLSNFAHTPFVLNGLIFQSVEGWWYWYTTGEKFPLLATYYGYEAKQRGRSYPVIKRVTHDILKEVYLAKLDNNPMIKVLLIDSIDEFDHYYVFNGKRVNATRWLWTAKLWEEIRDELRR